MTLLGVFRFGTREHSAHQTESDTNDLIGRVTALDPASVSEHDSMGH